MYVALDYGRRRVGIATSRSLIVASPYKILVIEKDPFLEILKELKTLKNIKKIFIGLPLHMDGNDSEMSLEVKMLKKYLEDYFGSIIELIDERLSSSFASNINRKRKKYIDDIVATEMLNNILASK